MSILQQAESRRSWIYGERRSRSARRRLVAVLRLAHSVLGIRRKRLALGISGIGRVTLAALAGSALLLPAGAAQADMQIGNGSLELCRVGIDRAGSYAIEYGGTTGNLNCPSGAGGAAGVSFSADNAGDRIGAWGYSAAAAYVTGVDNGGPELLAAARIALVNQMLLSDNKTVSSAPATLSATATDTVDGSRIHETEQTDNKGSNPQADSGTVAQTGSVPAISRDSSGADSLLWDSGAGVPGTAQEDISSDKITDVAPGAANAPSTDAINDSQPAEPSKSFDDLDNQAVKHDDAAKTEVPPEVTDDTAVTNVKAGDDLDAVNVSQPKGASAASAGGAAINAGGSIIVPIHNLTKTDNKANTVIRNAGDALLQLDDRVVTIIDNLPTAKDAPVPAARGAAAAKSDKQKNNAPSQKNKANSPRNSPPNGGSAAKTGSTVRKPAVLQVPPNSSGTAKPPRIRRDRGEGDSKYWIDGSLKAGKGFLPT